MFWTKRFFLWIGRNKKYFKWYTMILLIFSLTVKLKRLFFTKFALLISTALYLISMPITTLQLHHTDTSFHSRVKMYLHRLILAPVPQFSNHCSVWHTHCETWWTLYSVTCVVNVVVLCKSFLFFFFAIMYKKINWMTLILECSFWLVIPCMFTSWHILLTGE